MGTSLLVQWIRLSTPNAGDASSISGRGTRSHMLQLESPRRRQRLRQSNKFFFLKNAYVFLNHFVRHLKLTQHGKLTIRLKFLNKELQKFINLCFIHDSKSHSIQDAGSRLPHLSGGPSSLWELTSGASIGFSGTLSLRLA